MKILNDTETDVTVEIKDKNFKKKLAPSCECYCPVDLNNTIIVTSDTGRCEIDYALGGKIFSKSTGMLFIKVPEYDRTLCRLVDKYDDNIQYMS